MKITLTLKVEVKDFEGSKLELADWVASCLAGNDFDTCAVYYNGTEI